MTGARKRIVIATIGSLGDLHPYMAVALGLRVRGHDVVLAAPWFYRCRVEAAGVDFRPLRLDPPLQNRELYARALDPKKGPEFTLRDVLMPAVADTYDDLRTIIAEADANLLVSSPAVFAAPLIAEKIHIPGIDGPCTADALFSLRATGRAGLTARDHPRSVVSSSVVGTSAA